MTASSPRDEPDPRRRRARAGLAAGLAVLAAVAADAAAALWATGLEPLAPRDAAGALALALALAGLPAVAAGLLAATVEPPLTRAARRLGWRGALLAAAGHAAAAAAALALREREVDWTTVDPRLALCPLAAALAGLAAWFAAPRRLAPPLLALVVVAAGLELARSGGRGPAVERLRAATALAGPLLARGADAFDADGDGHPGRLCGEVCDCDDADPARHPGADERPDDGVDQDCDGDDRQARADEAFAALFVPPEPPPPATPAPALDRPDILLITIDTLRADHLGTYGYARDTSPRIDAWARGAVVFEQARSTGPSTRFSIPPLLVGKYFTEIARNKNEWPTLRDGELTLAERLHALGYVSAAFHSIRYFWPQYGLGQGFDHWSTACLDGRWPPLRASCSDWITDETLAWLDEHGRDPAQPLLLWSYYGDPHSQYMRHPGHPNFGSAYVDGYDDEIAFVDHHVGRLLDGVRARRTRPLVVVLLADHGEGLDPAVDHGSKHHSANLHDELVRVPLIVEVPGLAARRVATPVSLIDVVPTLLDLLGQPRDPALRGVSLVPWLRGEDPPHPPVIFEKHRALDDPQHGMVAWPYKVIRTMPGGRAKIFDLAADPGERRDLAGTLDPDERRRLVGALRHWHERVRVPFDDALRH
jgi:arylsulfatase A-like enzyme